MHSNDYHAITRSIYHVCLYIELLGRVLTFLFNNVFYFEGEVLVVHQGIGVQ